MERRRFIQISGLGSVLGAAAKVATGAEDDVADIGLAVGNPVVMAPREDGVEIVWRVRGLAKGYVEYGETKELGKVGGGDGWGLRPAGRRVLRVRLDGLEAGAEYFYRVVTEENVNKEAKVERGEIRSFRTLSARKETARFSVWNDTHKHDETIVRLGELTARSDFLLWNGDISNDWYREGEVAESILTPGGGVDFTRESPLVVLRGNHDYRGNLAYELEYSVATPEGTPWTAFRCGPVAAICMDTGEDKDDDHPHLFGRVACDPMRKEQAAWLEKVIEKPEFKEAPYRLLFCHIPLRWLDEKKNYGYDWFSKRSRDLWHDSLVKWGTQMVISGHIHKDYLIDADEEFPYAQLIGGGPEMMAQARLIVGEADGKALKLTMKDMGAKVVREVTLKPLV